MACCCRHDNHHHHDNERRLLTPVSQETNVLGFKGPRKMRVLLPAKVSLIIDKEKAASL